jgi:acetyl esterase/lipase
VNDATLSADGTLTLPARRIPLPSTVSDAARQSLASPRVAAGGEEPPASDRNAWRAYVAQRNQTMAELFGPMEKAFPCRMTPHQLSASTLYEVVPPKLASRNAQRAILYVHGGAYVLGGGRIAGVMAFGMASTAQMPAYSIDYRMPPDHPFPAGLGDVVEAYRAVLEQHKPANVAIGGVSAGGGLAAAAILKIRDLGLPLPGAAFIITPESDLTESGDSFQTNRGVDTVLTGSLRESIELYANGHDLRDPYVSANCGDFSKGFPPTVLVTGTRDLFLSNTVILHRALRRAGIEADLHVFEAMPHAGFFGAPEDAEVMDVQVRFLDRHLGTA